MPGQAKPSPARPARAAKKSGAGQRKQSASKQSAGKRSASKRSTGKTYASKSSAGKARPSATAQPAATTGKVAASRKRPPTAPGADSAPKAPKDRTGKPVKLLSGGNPQIAKGYGDAPVQAYIAAMPGWKSAVGRRLDAVITRTVPNVRKAVKWNSPLYGVEGDGWFLGVHVFTNYIKVAFFCGASLRPLPPGESKQKAVRYLDIREDGFDEAQFAAWVKQAAALPGEKM